MDYRQEAQKWCAQDYGFYMAKELLHQEEIKREKEIEKQKNFVHHRVERFLQHACNASLW